MKSLLLLSVFANTWLAYAFAQEEEDQVQVTENGDEDTEDQDQEEDEDIDVDDEAAEDVAQDIDLDAGDEDLDPEQEAFRACIDTCSGDDCTECFVIPNPNEQDIEASLSCFEACADEELSPEEAQECHLSCETEFIATGGTVEEDDDEEDEEIENPFEDEDPEDLVSNELDDDNDGEVDEEDESELAEGVTEDFLQNNNVDDDDDGEVDEEGEGEEVLAEDDQAASAGTLEMGVGIVAAVVAVVAA